MMGSPSPELVKYVHKHIKKGIHPSKIRETLLQAGHPADTIEAAFSKAPKKTLLVFFMLVIALSAIAFISFKVYQYVDYTKAVDHSALVAGMSDKDILLYAEKNNDASVCTSVKDDNMRYSCAGKDWINNLCYFDKIVDRQFLGCSMKQKYGPLFDKYCVPFKSYTDCKIAIAIGENNVDLCKNDTMCIAKFAIEKTSAETCKLLSKEEKNSCLFNIAKKTNNKEYCSGLDAVTNYCAYYFMSKEEKIAQLKSSISQAKTDHEQRAAIGEFADSFGDSCNEIDSLGKDYADYCRYYLVFQNLGKNTITSELCTQIVSSEIHSCCVESIKNHVVSAQCMYW
jgi:hypothetical protein